MRDLIPIIILILAVTGLCVWDGIYTHQVFDELTQKSNEIYTNIDNNNINFDELSKQVENLNTYWTEKMNVLCISISRKDLQPVSDYIQYLAGAAQNENAEDCLTYSRLLDYNIAGLSEANGISLANLL